MKRHRSFQDIRCSYFYLYREIRKRNNIIARKHNLEESRRRLLEANRLHKSYNTSRQVCEDLVSALNWEIQGCERDLENNISGIKWLKERIKRKSYQLG